MSEVTLTDSSGVERFRGTQAGGGSLTVSDGITTVEPATYLNFGGATVGDAGAGVADITVDAPSPDLAAVLAEGSNGGGLGMQNTGQIDTGADDVNTGGGAVNTGGGNVSTGGGDLVLDGGDLSIATQFRINADGSVGGTVIPTFWVALATHAANGSLPEIPAVPTPQDIVDALVTLGLVTQA